MTPVLPPITEPRILWETQLFGGVFKEGVRGRDLSLEEIDCFERGEEFESYVISQLNSVGLKASKT